MNRTRIVFAPHDPAAAPLYLLLNEFGEPVGRGEQPLQPPDPAVPTRVILVVPGVDVTVRWLHLPTPHEAQARAAAALLLQDEQALGEAPPHLALGPLEADGHRVAAAVDPARMTAWLDLARLHGLAPEAVVPEPLILPEPEDDLIAVRFGAALAVRGPRLAFACEPDLAPVLLEGRAPQIVEPQDAVEALIARGAAAPGVNLLQDAFGSKDASRPDRKDLIRAGALALALLLSPAIVNAAQALRLTLAADGVEKAAAKEVAGVLPKGVTVTDPARQATARLERLQLTAGGGPAGLAAGLFRALSEIDEAQVESLILSPDGAMRAQISHTNYSDMELLSASMRQAGASFREESSREEGGRIVSEVMLGARP